MDLLIVYYFPQTNEVGLQNLRKFGFSTLNHKTTTSFNLVEIEPRA